MKKKFEPFVVQYAKFSRLNLKDADGGFHENIGISEAKEKARLSSLDLVCFSEPSGNNLAFCRIIDYGKWKYSQEKNTKKEKKKSTKEIRLTPNISDHDVEHKLKKAKQFLEDKEDVLLFMKLRGRERAFFSQAEERMNEIIRLCENGKEVFRKKTGGNIAVRLTHKGGKDE